MSDFALLIAGTRTYDNYAELCTITNMVLQNHLADRICIVSGGAKGADALAKQYATERGYEFVEMPADWSLGKRAGYIRNRAMHEYISRFEHRGVLCFWDGKSRGTAHSFVLAKEFDNPLRVYNYSERRFLAPEEY